MTPPRVQRELPPELIELVLIFAWLEPRQWYWRVRDYLAYTTVCRLWRHTMLRVSLQFIHVNLIHPTALEALLQKPLAATRPGVAGEEERTIVSHGDICLLASFRIAPGPGLVSFLHTANILFPLTPRLVHVRLDFTMEPDAASSTRLPSTRTPAAILDTIISALESAPETLRTLEVICGCPSNPYGQASEASPSQLRFPNVEHLYIDSDNEVLVLDLVSRCVNLSSLRLTCAFAAIGRLPSKAPHLRSLALNIDPHPAVRLSGHLPFFVKRDPLQNWKVLDAVRGGLLGGQAASSLLLEKSYHSCDEGDDMNALRRACQAAGIQVRSAMVDPSDRPCYHDKFLTNNPDKQRLKKMVAFFVP
ncbi:hypothetical protein EXIGLDRAFT_720024 [Exidia glandulosa HHB12029]|uniref:Uncharacterized protein n=1 Tax=Exidia glandulosa HHB12029 TaxID=1314781 RepID=A0A165NMD1_EXIGL|nr:hypothetical protein EXIGLDRAFT_720024 [Exidia glandulosa HHB12029]